MQNPKDFGYEKPSFELPKLNYIEHIVLLEKKPSEMLFHFNAVGLQERQKARREGIEERTTYAAEIVNNLKDNCLVWCGLNDESEMLKNKINDYRDWETDRKSTRLNSSHSGESRMPASA